MLNLTWLDLQSAIVRMTDMELLEQLCSTVNDEHHYDAFVNRFLHALKVHCQAVCNTRKLDSHVGQQIAHETFERVRRYKSFKRGESRFPDDRKAILVYLKKISIRLFNDHHNQQKRNDIIHTTYFDAIFEAVSANIDVKELKNKKDVALLIFGKLNKKEQAIIAKDIEYKKHQKYLPDDVTASLAVDLGVKPDTIRKIRARAIIKIKKAIDEVNKN